VRERTGDRGGEGAASTRRRGPTPKIGKRQGRKRYEENALAPNEHPERAARARARNHHRKREKATKWQKCAERGGGDEASGARTRPEKGGNKHRRRRGTGAASERGGRGDAATRGGPGGTAARERDGGKAQSEDRCPRRGPRDRRKNRARRKATNPSGREEEREGKGEPRRSEGEGTAMSTRAGPPEQPTMR